MSFPVCVFVCLCVCVCVCVCVSVWECVFCACGCLTCRLVYVGVVLKSTTSMAGSDREPTVRLTSTSEQVVNLKNSNWGLFLNVLFKCLQCFLWTVSCETDRTSYKHCERDVLTVAAFELKSCSRGNFWKLNTKSQFELYIFKYFLRFIFLKCYFQCFSVLLCSADVCL